MARNEKLSFNNTRIIQDNYIYISHLDDDIKFWRIPSNPETIADTMGSTFAETSALGRSAPVFTYSKSGPRTVQVEIKLHRDMMDDVNMGFSNSKLNAGEDYIENLVHALQAIAVPKYNLSNKAIEPPLVALRLSNQVFIKGVVNSPIAITYKLPLLSNGKYAEIHLSLTITEVDPYDASTVYKNGSFRGVMQMLKNGMNIED